jgi:hypothetical protein
MVRGFQAAHSQTAAAAQPQAESLSPFVVTIKADDSEKTISSTAS